MLFTRIHNKEGLIDL